MQWGDSLEAMVELSWAKEEHAYLIGEPMDPAVIFRCGQAFRFSYDSQMGAYGGIAHKRQIWCRKLENGMEIFPVTPEQIEEIWWDYFDLGFCYPPKEMVSGHDAVLLKAIECCRGLRILRQEPFETIVAFILSANNNIARIRGIIEKLCALAGEQIAPGAFAFPEPRDLAALQEEQLLACGAGYRAKYVLLTARKIAGGYDLQRFFHMDYPSARKELCEFPGVGPKVADCILLFAYQKREAFPADVWIRRMLCELYGFEAKSDRQIMEFAARHFGVYGGIAQQYLFHYMRKERGKLREERESGGELISAPTGKDQDVK